MIQLGYKNLKTESSKKVLSERKVIDLIKIDMDNLWFFLLYYLYEMIMIKSYEVLIEWILCEVLVVF